MDRRCALRAALALVLGLLTSGVPARAQAASRGTCSPQWVATFGGPSGAPQGPVRALAVFDDGGGPALYAAGEFTSAGGVAANRIARWDGASWSALGDGLDATVHALAVHDDGSGPALYAAGEFTGASGVAASRIARWDGTSWSALADGLNGRVRTLAVLDDGGGPALYAGGAFTGSGRLSASRVAKWDGLHWSAVGAGTSGEVRALVAHDDGSGAALYAGGSFASAGGVTAPGLARWDGATWSRPGAPAIDDTHALAVWDDGGGARLFACRTVGGFAALTARWDGAVWSNLGAAFAEMRTLAAFDDGSGPALYVGGSFGEVHSVPASRLARWDGAGWSALGSGFDSGGSVLALAAFDAGDGLALFAGGDFAEQLDSGDAWLARWAGCPDSVPPVLACPEGVLVLDSFTAPGRVVTFVVTATDNLDPAPQVTCVPPSGSVFPPGTTLVTCTAVDGRGNQATCQFPVTVRYKARPGAR